MYPEYNLERLLYSSTSGIIGCSKIRSANTALLVEYPVFPIFDGLNPKLSKSTAASCFEELILKEIPERSYILFSNTSSSFSTSLFKFSKYFTSIFIPVISMSANISDSGFSTLL